MKRTAVGIGVLVALAVLLAAGMGGVAAQTQPTNETTGSGNASFGATVSSFMQASSAEAEGEVDDGMFEASLNRAETAEERRALVEQRQERLQQRQQRLANRRAELSESDSDVRSRAIAAGVTTGASGLEESVNDTESVARSVGVDTAALEELRTEARNLSGGEVAELARGVGLGAAMRGSGGPPEDIGPNKDDTENGPNVSIDAPGEEDGSPSVNRGNETDDGASVGGDDDNNADNNADPESDDGDDNNADSDRRGADSGSTAGGSSDGNPDSETDDESEETGTDRS